MKVKKPPLSESRRREARASLRMHDDLRSGLQFVAEADRRTMSQYLEILVLDHLRTVLRNEFTSQGELVNKTSPLVFRDGKGTRSR
jgi:hypothetical protein